LSMRKASLSRLLGPPRRRNFPVRSRAGRHRSRPVSTCLPDGAGGPGSGHKDRPNRAGRSTHWVKVKNRKRPAMNRVMDSV
jgi:hypothetical protein